MSDVLQRILNQLGAIDGRTVTVKQETIPAERPLTEDEADRIHDALLKKQRGGSLGLNE